MRSCNSEGPHDVVGVTGDDHTDRHLAIVGAIRGVERATALIEPHFSVERGSKIRGKAHGINVPGCPLYGGLAGTYTLRLMLNDTAGWIDVDQWGTHIRPRTAWHPVV